MGKTAKKQTEAVGGSPNADAAKRRAIEYCLFNYPTLYTGGIPRRSMSGDENEWVVPIVLDDPEAGISGEVGEVRIDGRTQQIVGSTPVEKVLAAEKGLYKSAFCRA